MVFQKVDKIPNNDSMCLKNDALQKIQLDIWVSNLQKTRFSSGTRITETAVAALRDMHDIEKLEVLSLEMAVTLSWLMITPILTQLVWNHLTETILDSLQVFKEVVCSPTAASYRRCSQNYIHERTEEEHTTFIFTLKWQWAGVSKGLVQSLGVSFLAHFNHFGLDEPTILV